MRANNLLCLASAAAILPVVAWAQVPSETIATAPMFMQLNDSFHCTASNPGVVDVPLRVQAFNNLGSVIGTFDGIIRPNQTVTVAAFGVGPRWCRFQSTAIKEVRGAAVLRHTGGGGSALPAF